ncbi:MAG: hypothetical protein WC471_04695 [Candidatus Woesearchaeota archaeon]
MNTRFIIFILLLSISMFSAESLTLNPTTPPSNVNLNTTFQLKCDFGANDILCVNAMHGDKYCQVGPWEGTSVVFNCLADKAGIKENYCNIFYYDKDPRCVPQQNMIGTTEVIDSNPPQSLIFKNVNPAPLKLNLSDKFQIKCDYGANDILCINARHGDKYCQVGPWDGTAAVFNCVADSAGVKDNYCNIFDYSADPRCKAQQNMIGKTEVMSSQTIINSNPDKSISLDMTLNEQLPACRGYYFKECDKGMPEEYCTKCSTLSDIEIKNTLSMLKYYNFNKLYLIYHNQFSIDDYKANLIIWKKYGDVYGIKLVPMFGLMNSPNYENLNVNLFNFEDSQLLDLVKYSNNLLKINEISIADVPGVLSKHIVMYQHQTEFLKANIPGLYLSKAFAQPYENPSDDNSDGYIIDTWTYIIACLNNDDWMTNKAAQGWTRQDLINYIKLRNNQKIYNVWDLIIVAWPYEKTETNNTCLFVADDASLNDPTPLNRNILATQLICDSAKYSSYFKGFHTDGMILGLSSNVKDGNTEQNFYKSLKQGKVYTGYFNAPLNEIKYIFSQKNPCDGIPPYNLKCVDSDNGLNYNVKGIVSPIDGTTSTDVCSDVISTGKGLVEYSCDTNGIAKYTGYICPNGCKDGSCMNASVGIIICPMDTKTCPDGTILKRIGSKCTFADCPAEVVPTCNGCLLNNKCLPFGIRTSGKYCDKSGDMILQNGKNVFCNNSYECVTNSCINNKCSAPGILRRFINWFGAKFN